MILGLSTSAFTTFHVVLSLIGIVAGLVAVIGMLGSRTLDGWTAIFLGTTILTSVTGFFFPVDKVLPSHVVGVISLVVLAAAVLALSSIASADRGAGSTQPGQPWRYTSTSIRKTRRAGISSPLLHALAHLAGRNRRS